MANKKFRNYWFATGTHTFLVELVQQKEYDLPDLENLIVHESLLSTFDVDDIPMESLLWQTGYLTIKQEINLIEVIHYQLSYPNFEVEYSLNQHLLRYLVKNSKTSIGNLGNEILLGLQNSQLSIVEIQLKKLFSGISYNFSQHIKDYEGYYGSVIYAFFKGLGLDCILEDHTIMGRIDLTLKLRDKIYLFEFKMKHHQEEALHQIKVKIYYEKYLSETKEIFT
ncbi:MAG: PD-(D/E)XK nuclease domain-containing protein [Bacteroidia bacterium]|nr:PD-(D/E)XK nuclease domain-containing protein [Bacteroidia bacterium]